MSLKKALNNNNNNNKQSKIIPIYKFTFASIKHCGSTILTKTHTHTQTHIVNSPVVQWRTTVYNAEEP
jgi:hypothetical protein